MQATIAISKWVSSTLNDNGFDASRIKVKINELLPVAMAGEARKSADYWTGLYHIIPFDGYVCLYTYSQTEKNGHFYKSKISATDMEPVDQPVFEPEDMAAALNKSRQASLNDPKFHQEMNAVQNFIAARNGSLEATQDLDESSYSVTSDLDSDELISSEHDFDDVHGVKQESQDDFNHDMNNQEVVGSVVVADLLELFDVLDSEINPDHWVNHVYRGLEGKELGCLKVINKHVEFSNPDRQIDDPLLGNVIIKYNDSSNSHESVISIASLTNEGFYIEVPYFIGEENNFAVIGGGLGPDDKWYFVANDFNSALSLYRATGVKTVAAAKGVDMGFVFNEILSHAPNAKIRFFRNESINMRPARLESLKYDAQYGIGHIFIDRGLLTWADYSNLYLTEYGDDADAKFRILINEAIQEGKKYLESV